MTKLQHNLALGILFILMVSALATIETWMADVKTKKMREDYSKLQNQYNELKYKVDILERKQNCEDNGGVLIVDYLGNSACALLKSRWGA